MADTLIQGTTIIEDKRTGKQQTWSCSGSAFFTPDSIATDFSNWDDPNFGTLLLDATTPAIKSDVNLPNGAKITGAVVYGNDAGETWTLYRSLLTAGTIETVATAAIGTEDIIITNAIVDNLTYSYFFLVKSLDSSDEIYGAKITYTT